MPTPTAVHGLTGFRRDSCWFLQGKGTFTGAFRFRSSRRATRGNQLTQD